MDYGNISDGRIASGVNIATNDALSMGDLASDSQRVFEYGSVGGSHFKFSTRSYAVFR